MQIQPEPDKRQTRTDKVTQDSSLKSPVESSATESPHLPKKSETISFGPNGEHSFNELGREVALELIEAGAKSLKVTHIDGWDRIELDLEEKKPVDVKSKIHTYAPSLSFSKRLLLGLLKSVEAGPIVSYSGKIMEDNTIEVKDISGVEIFTHIPLFGAAIPKRACLKASGEAEAELDALGSTRKERTKLKPSLHTLIVETIKAFDRFRS